MTEYNLIVDTDSYKTSHFLQMPEDADAMFSYVESRGGKFSKTVMFGIRYIIEKYLTKKITKKNIDRAEKIAKLQNMPFNRKGWEYIVEKHDGYIPVRIKSVREGTVVEAHNALVTIESTDPKVFWVVGYIEPLILRVWYPITVASLSYDIKQNIIKKYVDKTSDFPESLVWKLHDFGARACTSYESSCIGGAAHLINFAGSDTMAAINMIFDLYDIEDFMVGSVPASEHSTMTSWGRENENEAYKNMLSVFASDDSEYKSPILACVSDAYDIIKALDNIWGTELKGQIQSSDTLVAIRPDSGSPLFMVMMTLQKLDEHFGHTVNTKGYKVLKNVRIVQGDGVDSVSIEEILNYMELQGWSTDNIVFGMGGALLQKINRDTNKFALKCSAIRRSGVWHDVYKDPITDKGKMSKKGIIDMFYDDATDRYVTLTGGRTAQDYFNKPSALNVFYENGKTFFDETEDSFEMIRKRASF